MQSIPSTFADLLKSIPTWLGIPLDEEPRYEPLTMIDGDIEIRRYQPLIVAQLDIHGDHEDAFARGLERLQRYFEGANDAQLRLASTPELRHEMFSGGWKISMALTGVDEEALPRAYDRSIRVLHMPEHLVAAFRYRGEEHEAERDIARLRLLSGLEHHPEYVPISRVYWARLDPPQTLSLVRRNEARVELDSAALPRTAPNDAATWMLAGLPIVF